MPKTLEIDLALNTCYNDYLQIFHPWERYLYLADEAILVIIRNLRLKKKKNWDSSSKYLLFGSVGGSRFFRRGAIKK